MNPLKRKMSCKPYRLIRSVIFSNSGPFSRQFETDILCIPIYFRGNLHKKRIVLDRKKSSGGTDRETGDFPCQGESPPGSLSRCESRLAFPQEVHTSLITHCVYPPRPRRYSENAWTKHICWLWRAVSISNAIAVHPIHAGCRPRRSLDRLSLRRGIPRCFPSSGVCERYPVGTSSDVHGNVCGSEKNSVVPHQRHRSELSRFRISRASLPSFKRIAEISTPFIPASPVSRRSPITSAPAHRSPDIT